MTVTIHDVAKLCGCSITTVSHALNGFSDVSDATREKVMRIAKELEYRPNRIAQSLVTKKSNTLGVFVLGKWTFQHPVVYGMVSGLLDVTSENDFDILLFGAKSLQGISPSKLCAQKGVGGAVGMVLPMGDSGIREMAESGFPIVLIDTPIAGKKATYITSNNQEGAYQAVKHLVELGHRHIGLINGSREAWVSMERCQGYKKALSEFSLPYKPGYIVNGDFTKESGKTGARGLIGENPELTALFVISDIMASGAIEELVGLGYRIPEDISIVGFDNLDLAAHIIPPLTTLKQNFYQMGVEAGKELIAMVNGSHYMPQVHILYPELVVRDSTGSARIR